MPASSGGVDALIKPTLIDRPAPAVVFVRQRVTSLVIAALFVSLIVLPAASAFEEIELQTSTDALAAASRTTVDHVFWRSGFGASVIGGPTYAGNVGALAGRTAEFEAMAAATMPNGSKPQFLEFATLDAPTYSSGAGNDSNYATQRWNFTSPWATTGAWTIGAGAAAQAAWAAKLANATGPDQLFALWLIEALSDRVNATRAGGAYTGSTLGAFNFSDPALNDRDPSNGWQRVPSRLTVDMSTDPEPLFQGFLPLDNSSTLGPQAALVLGLAEIMALSNPAGPNAALFDGSPFDGSLYANSRELLHTVVVNAEAYHWDSIASAYGEPDAAFVSTGDLALFLRAVAVAEKAATDADLKANLTATRTRAATALSSLADAGGVLPGTYTIGGSTVTPDFSTVTLWGQAQSVEAFAAVYAVTGLKADGDWMFKAAAGLESRLFYQGSYHALSPEPVESTFSAQAVGATLGALRDLAVTGDEPLAVYRFGDAFANLFQSPPLTLAGAQTPPVIGASFGWNSTAVAYTPAADFSGAGAMYAAYELISTGPEFFAAVGGGVSVTERAALVLHNATTADVGVEIDTLDQQIAALNNQIAALQGAFDALNASVTNATDRLNLSLENETISAQRIIDLQANVTALRAQLANSTVDRDVYRGTLDNMTVNLTELETRFLNLTNNLTLARQEAQRNGGLLNQTLVDLDNARTQLNTTNATLAERTRESAAAQQSLAVAMLVAAVVGIVLGLFIHRVVRLPGSPEAKAAKQKAAEEKAEAKAEAEKDNGDDE